jgi:hypothetical protein
MTKAFQRIALPSACNLKRVIDFGDQPRRVEIVAIGADGVVSGSGGNR